MLRADSTLVDHRDLIESDEVQTQAMPVPDRFGTHWMPATHKLPPSRDFASAAGAMTVVQDRQALADILWENPVPNHDRVSSFAPWGDVVRDMTHDSKSLIYLPLIVIAGLLVMMWIFKVNGPDAMNYTITPRATTSAQTSQRVQTPVKPSQRHRKPVVPAPAPNKTQTRETPVSPAPTRSEAPEPTHTYQPKPPSPKPTPRHTATPKPTPKPTKTVEPTKEPTPDPTPTREPTQEPKPTVEPSTRTVEPTREPVGTQESVVSATPRS